MKALIPLVCVKTVIKSGEGKRWNIREGKKEKRERKKKITEIELKHGRFSRIALFVAKHKKKECVPP